ncbi:MAG: hypothetical protein V7L28_24660 [Nostoc sp.]
MSAIALERDRFLLKVGLFTSLHKDELNMTMALHNHDTPKN